MDVESLAKQLILQNMTPEQQTAVLDSIRASVTQAKDVQKQRIGENVQVVVQALKKLEADIKARYDETGKAIEKRVATIKDGKMVEMVRMARPVEMVDQVVTVLLALVVLMASMVETVVMETMVFPLLMHTSTLTVA